MSAALIVGTRKGLFFLHADDARRSFELEGPLLPGWSVNHAIVDPRDGVLYACTNNWVYGGTVHRSADRGQTWERAETLGLPGGVRAEARLDLARRAGARHRA